jgi:hypothetical protein
MSDNNNPRYLEALRQIKLLENKVAKFDHQLKNAALLDRQKQEQIEDLKSQLELQQKSVINLAQSMKHPTGDSFIEKLTLKLYNLVITRYDRLSELEISSLTSTLISSPFLSLIIGGIILRDPSKPFSLKDIMKITKSDINDIIEWIEWFISSNVLVEYEDGRFQARQFVIDKVFSYKDITKISLDQLFADFRAKMALSVDQRQFDLLLRQLLEELNRRKLQIASKELEKILAELGLGFKKPDWVFEQVVSLYQIAKENQEIVGEPEQIFEEVTNELSEESTFTSISAKRIRFTPKSMPPKPIYERFTVETGLKASMGDELKVTTVESSKVEQEVDSKEQPDEYASVIPEKIDEASPRQLFEIFLNSRKDIMQLESKKEIEQSLIKLRDNLEDVLSGRVIFELSQLIAELRKEEKINIDEILSKIDKWSSY